MDHRPMIVPPKKKIHLTDYDPSFTGPFKSKKGAEKKLRSDVTKLAEYQDILYASDTYGVLIIFQAMDAAGKDGAIKHVMSGINPQGCQVFSFKAPSVEELDHDYLWRCMRALPERGRIGIFNRSYYEEVLVARVHPEILGKQRIPSALIDKGIWKNRYEEINNFERYLTQNGIVVVKFFLNVSKEEQKRRFLKRINRPEKNWKFSINDLSERSHWDEYMKAYEEMFTHTSTKEAPWHIIPSDHKWFLRAAVADVLVEKMKSLKLHYPRVSKKHQEEILRAKEILESE